MGINGKQPALHRVALRRQIRTRTDKTPSAVETSSALSSAAARLAGSAMFSPPAWAAIARSLELSGRELQIARGVFDDQQELIIANALGVSAHTIRTHVERPHHKLALTDRAQLLQRVMQEFLTLTASPATALPPRSSAPTFAPCALKKSSQNVTMSGESTAKVQRRNGVENLSWQSLASPFGDRKPRREDG